MKIKDILKLIKNHNPEANINFEFVSDNSMFTVSSKDNCIHCEKEVYLKIGTGRK